MCDVFVCAALSFPVHARQLLESEKLTLMRYDTKLVSGKKQ